MAQTSRASAPTSGQAPPAKPAQVSAGAAAAVATVTVTAAAAAAGEWLPTSEAVWRCYHGEGDGSPLELSVRFVLREGPMMAIPGLLLHRMKLHAGISHLFTLALGAQAASDACVTAANAELEGMERRRAEVRDALAAMPERLKAEEERLLKEFTTALNAQKRQLRRLWEAGRRDATLRAAGGMPAFVARHVPASLGECLDRAFAEGPGPLPSDAAARDADDTAAARSLTFASPPPAAASQMDDRQDTLATCFADTIPLVLGMDDGLGGEALPRSVGRGADAVALAAAGGGSLSSGSNASGCGLAVPPSSSASQKRPAEPGCAGQSRITAARLLDEPG